MYKRGKIQVVVGKVLTRYTSSGQCREVVPPQRDKDLQEKERWGRIWKSRYNKRHMRRVRDRISRVLR
ncbi:hypothetical protein WN55_06228 [Dufourea novaeangliae]|uniref:Uncharacterized protein n=1 Tax=Dufourea novaeangliae TaxID=178035 RepID=A0A154PQ44_DUFNO|nr:hypothetical protein WN55_06228 [Dufourea novaeangliae]